MAYLKVNNTDISGFVSALKITKTANYTAQANATGDTVVDYINEKRKIEIDLIPMEQADFDSISSLLTFEATVAYRDPSTGVLSSNVSCICKARPYEYYTIQSNRVLYKAMKLTYEEL